MLMEGKGKLALVWRVLPPFRGCLIQLSFGCRVLPNESVFWTIMCMGREQPTVRGERPGQWRVAVRRQDEPIERNRGVATTTATAHSSRAVKCVLDEEGG